MKSFSLFVLILFVVGCTPHTSSPPLGPVPPQGPFTVSITFEDKPLLNKEVFAVIEVKSESNTSINSTKIYVHAQDNHRDRSGDDTGFVILDDSGEKNDLFFEEKFEVYETKKYRFKVKTKLPGYYILTAFLVYNKYPDLADYYNPINSGALYFQVTKTDVILNITDPPSNLRSKTVDFLMNLLY